MNWHDGLVLT